jgi:hypothetical protein
MERKVKSFSKFGAIAWSTKDEIQMIATGAVLNAATRELRCARERRQIEDGAEAFNAQKFTNAEQNAANAKQSSEKPEQSAADAAWRKATPANGEHLTARRGRFQGVSGMETWYNLPMGNVVYTMRQLGFDEELYPFWIREDGCKMLGEYIMIAANLEVRPKGTLVETSLGTGIVCDTGTFCEKDKTAIDIAVNW